MYVLIVVLVYYHALMVYGDFFEDGLFKPAVATMAEGNISISDLPLCFGWFI